MSYLWNGTEDKCVSVTIKIWLHLCRNKMEFKRMEKRITMTDKTWGGARPGSGRKPADPKDKRVQMVITIDRETREKLKAMAKEMHIRVGRIIDNLVDESPEF